MTTDARKVEREAAASECMLRLCADDGAPSLTLAPAVPAHREARTAQLDPSGAQLILLAEDDEDIVDLVSTRLERSGYRVVRVRDGAEAVRLAHELKPALAVFDIAMPLLSGLDATRALRADPETATLPIILLTARAAPGDVAAGLEAAATAYVTKPFSPQDLARRIDGVLGNA